MTLFRFPLKKSVSDRPSVQAVLDVGSSKICCMVGKLTPHEERGLLAKRSHSIDIIGFGLQRSRGIKSGVVVDMDEAEEAIRLAVDAAERSSGMTIDSLTVSVSAGRIASETFQSQIDIDGREVRHDDIRSVLAAGRHHVMEDGRSTLHAMPIGFSLDAEANVVDPVGMVGNKLGVDMHVVSADAAPLRNLELCINRSHLSVDRFVAAPYASGLSSLVADEIEMGTACIDIGGGTTTLAIFLHGKLVFADAIAVGGNHVTMDLARCFSIRLKDAERIKVLHGTTFPSQADEEEILSAASMDQNNRNPVQMSVAHIGQVIRPRVEETFELIRDRINNSGFASVLGGRVTLTGGASQLSGMTEVASSVLGSKVRLGRPLGVAGMKETAKGPAFSAAAGLMIYPQIKTQEYQQDFRPRNSTAIASGGAFGRMGRWLRESF